VDKTQDLKKFGANLRALRELRKLSQEQLADSSDMHRTYLSGIERGIRNPSLHNILRLARALDVTLADLLEGLK
jgi:transcriptional regulator with XRE-family HTH domain